MRVTLFTDVFRNGHIFVPGIGNAKVNMEIVVGLQLDNQTRLEFRNHGLETRGENLERMDLPSSMAKRLKEFCKRHYVDGVTGFDCCSFVFHVMGWRGGSVRERPLSRGVSGPIVQPNNLVTGKPYSILSDAKSGEAKHFMLGIPHKEFGLGVGGANQPLLIASNADMMRAYNGSVVIEVQKPKYG